MLNDLLMIADQAQNEYKVYLTNEVSNIAVGIAVHPKLEMASQTNLQGIDLKYSVLK